ncbi:MAG: tRNA (N6-threonylcarbamoyladenosine(37)-N6)-methyltransferase TrmO [Anaerobacillus sp.]|uniref:tRNA (N6-threonylcarbamoyladenosine(37)-N6)-methyltransferase TrmO n=1 Tax=Anaerobacillus sp. TaxID=1872506 RepID=UPI00391A1826
MDSVNLKSIGTVYSTIDEQVYENWGKVISKVELNRDYLDGLMGLEEYSHAIVIFYMDRFRDQFSNEWKGKPRGIADLEEKGCFALRTKYRPNPIGIAVVELLSVKENILTVKGLDANDGTIVLDIKPYIPDFDSRENVKIPNWMNELMKGYF